MRFAMTVLVALFAAAPARPGIVYEFRTTVEAPRASTQVSGRVWVDGDSYRVELPPDPARSVDVVISTDRDRTALFLDVDKRTWMDRVRASSDVRSSSMFRWPLPKAVLRGRPVVESSVADRATVAGHEATIHAVKARFEVESRIDGEKVRGTIEATARLWIAEDLPDLPMSRELRTGYAEVDRLLAPVYARIPRGMIVRHELEVVRTLAGGPPQKEVTKTVVAALEVVDVPRERFAIPPDFVYAGGRAP